MKKMTIVLVFVITVIISGCTGPTQEQAPQSEQNEGPSTTVDIRGFEFEPMVTTITSGTTVTWTNRDSTPHTVTGGNFDSGSIPQGGTFSKTFTEKGPYEYHCNTHLNMQGRVDVDTI